MLHPFATVVGTVIALGSTNPAKTSLPPVIDGRDDDIAWQSAKVITEFQEHEPREGGDPRFKTEARITYDSRNLYVFVRAYDTAPDSIVALLSRRDLRTPSDYIHVMIDSYHDRRTGFRFTVNPVGVKRDVYISNDGNEDLSWDSVWDVATAIDSLGWTAEYRIPFSQLRFPPSDNHTFGFAIWRDIARYGERLSWPLYRRSQTGFVSQFGEITGFTGIESPRKLELLPYVSASNSPRPQSGGGYTRHQGFALGADIKYGITSSLTLDGTVNPDFGQVEADPAVLNLSAFEQFYGERRPFFLEGAGIFNFANNLFYSRRIGRDPQLSGLYSDPGNPQQSTILGAAKLTGQTAGGLNIGLLNAVTQRETGSLGRTIEPQTNFLVVSLQQDMRNGNSAVGTMITAVNRSIDADTRDYLRDGAYAAGIGARHRFGGNNYQITGSAVMSHVTGSTEAMLRTQRSAVHYYQRPDTRHRLDSNATSMSGSRLALGVGKTGGGVSRFEVNFTNTSGGYEVNDAGFLNRADMQVVSAWQGFSFINPTRYYRRAWLNFNQFSEWNTDRLLLGAGGNVNFEAELPNHSWVWAGSNFSRVGGGYDDRVSRGGPAIRRDMRNATWFGYESDNRKSIIGRIETEVLLKDVTGSYSWYAGPMVTARVASRLQTSLGFRLNHSVNDSQWYQNFVDVDGTVNHTFAHLDQRTVSMTARLDYTVSPTLSLQLYAEPFVSVGDYSDLREVVDPRASRYEDRFAPYTSATPQDFNVKQFRSNTVLRWEYRPGSALFFVWQQGRGESGVGAGNFDLGRDFANLFKTRSDNTFLIKGSYWLSF